MSRRQMPMIRVGLIIVLLSNALTLRLAWSYKGDIATSCHAIKAFIASDVRLRLTDDHWRPVDEVAVDNAFVAEWRKYGGGIKC